jgi:hypothetical protein
MASLALRVRLLEMVTKSAYNTGSDGLDGGKGGLLGAGGLWDPGAHVPLLL